MVDRLRRGGQAPLQDRQGEADRAGALVVLEGVGTIELLAHVLGDLSVEVRLGIGELVGHRVGDALGKEGPTVELEEVLLDHSAHQVGDLDLVHAVAEAPLEAVTVEERQEELEVLLLAVVGRRGHQQEVPGEAREELAEAIALGVLDLAAEESGGELVGLVAHDQVVAAVRSAELFLDVFVAGKLVEPRDGEVVLEEPVAGAGRFELVVGEDLEGQVEPTVQLVLPLLGEAAGTNDKATVQVAACDQLLDEQPRHDRLAGAGIVGKEKPERLTRKHRLVDGRNLMRQGLDQRRVDCQNRVEEMSEADPVGFGGEAEQCPVSIEAPRPAELDDL